MNIKYLLAGIGGLIFSTLLALHPPRTLTPDQVVITAGRISRTELTPPKRNMYDLYVWIQGHEVPFRIDASKLTPTGVERIRRAQFASIGIAAEDLGKPKINRFKNQPLYNLISIEVDRQPIYTLERYNTETASLAKVMKWFLPAWALGSIWAIYSGIKRQR